MTVVITSWTGATVVAEDTTDHSFSGWGSVSNAQGSQNATYAFGTPETFGGTEYDSYVRLVVANTVQTAVNKANGQYINSNVDKDLIYGGATDTWGQTLTPAIVNNSGFGASFAIGNNDALKGTGYGFTIPTAAQILGVEYRVRAKRGDNGFSYAFAMVDALEMRIYYTTDYSISGGGHASGMLLGDNDTSVALDKRYQYKIYEKGLFLGEWDDVANEPEFKEQINTLGTTMPIKLGRNLDNVDPIPYGMSDQTDDEFLTQDGDTLFGYFESGNSLGSGSDADVNYDVNAYAYYGGYDYLITQDGETLVTQDYDVLYVVDGAPEGRSLFSGFISQWETGYGDQEEIDTSIMSYGWEANQYIIESVGTTPVNVSPTGYIAFGTTSAQWLTQTFLAPSSGNMAQLKLWLRMPSPQGTNGMKFGNAMDVSITLYINGSPTILATATKTINSGNHQFESSFNQYVFDLGEYVPLTSGVTYKVVIQASLGNTDVDFGPIIQTGTSLAGATLQSVTSASVASTISATLAMGVVYAGGNTTVSFTSVDPSTILKAVIDSMALRGSHLRYTSDSIQMTGTTVTYTFKTNTGAEGIRKVLELCPADWYYYLDVSTSIVYLKPRPTTPDHVFTLERDISTFRIKRDMESIVNEAYFSGGGTPALFVKTTDQASLNEWRRGLTKLADNRVTDTTSATIISQAEIDRNKDPLYTVTMTIPASAYDIETIFVGQLAAFRGFNNFIDDLELQIVEKNYTRDVVTLTAGSLRQPVSKRVEDLKRNLDLLEQVNNPTSPV